MSFPTAAQLDKHRAKFCQGSQLHRSLVVKRNRSQGAVANALDEDALTALSRGLSSLGGDAVEMTVTELRNKVTSEAAARTAERKVAETAAERAAARLSEQRAKADVQRELIETRLAAQRVIELQARVQLQASERMAESLELKAKARVQKVELAQLLQRQEELAAKRSELTDEASRVQDALATLHAGTQPASQAILEARTQVKLLSMEPLSEAAEAKRQALLRSQAERTRAAQLERNRLLARQQELEEEDTQRAETAAAVVVDVRSPRHAGGDRAQRSGMAGAVGGGLPQATARAPRVHWAAAAAAAAAAATWAAAKRR